MTNPWDEFSKSLAQPLPRRESLRRLGAVFTATVLAPLGTGFARGGPPPKQQDPCKAFCNCRGKKQQDQCLKACSGCGNDPTRLGGSCGNYFCCSAGQTSCGNYCADLGIDPYNCGDCGYVCRQPRRNEYGACIDGSCEYRCVEGAVGCDDGTCAYLDWDPYNCGACGNVCPGPNATCYQGTCSHCTPSCPERWCGGNGCGGECACPSGTYCEYDGWCYDICSPGLTWCDPGCVDLSSDPYNCGACYRQCAPNEVCAGGSCQGF